jgi:CRISPR/Cas system-associated endonuclease Cas1
MKMINVIDGISLSPIPEFDNYGIDVTTGRIYSFISQRWLNQKGIRKNGYLMTTLKHNSGKSKGMYIHELVYSAYIQKPKSFWREENYIMNDDGELEQVPLTINHMDRNKKNNCYKNLEAKSHKDQFTEDVVKDISTNRKRLSKDEVIQIKKEFAKWEGIKTDFCLMMAAKMGVVFNTIESIINGKSHKKVIFEW